MIRKGDKANGTGDLNFAACCMAVGIPLDGARPVQAVKSDTGEDYCRVYLREVSLDGQVTIDLANKAWCDPAWATTHPRLRGFVMVMDFIRGRPHGVRGAGEWMSWAHDHLRALGEKGCWNWPRRLEEIPPFVAAHPEERAGYVFAFVLNRDLCHDLTRRAGEDPHLLINRGKNHTLLRENAPEWKKRQLLEMIG